VCDFHERGRKAGEFGRNQGNWKSKGKDIAEGYERTKGKAEEMERWKRRKERKERKENDEYYMPIQLEKKTRVEPSPESLERTCVYACVRMCVY